LLSAALHDERWEVRSAALERLWRVHGGISTDLVERALRDENRYVRMAALSVLQQTGGESALNLVRAAREDEDWQVREFAVALSESLANLTGSYQSPSFDEGENRPVAVRLPPTATPEGRQIRMNTVEPTPTPVTVAPPESGNLSGPRRTPRPVHPATPRKLPYGLHPALLVAAVVLVMAVFTAAGVGWWSGRFGSPDLYSAVSQQQTHLGVTIRVTRVYADQGRTIIAYDTFSHDKSKQYFADAIQLIGSAPQRPEAMGLTFGDAPVDGVTHFYIVEAPFVVPANVATLVLTLDIGSVIVTTPGQSTQGSSLLAGPWHFSFTVPFHHVNNSQIPSPIQGGSTPVARAGVGRVAG
jgi:hypothetical protein